MADTRGRWEGEPREERCSVCGEHPLKEMDMDTGDVFYWSFKPPYCPNCGSEMEV